MGVFSLFQFPSRSTSTYRSPPPSLSQITPPSLQLHHDLQCPSSVFKASGQRLQHLALDPDRPNFSSGCSASRHTVNLLDLTDDQVSSITCKSAKRKFWRASFSSKKRASLTRRLRPQTFKSKCFASSSKPAKQTGETMGPYGEACSATLQSTQERVDSLNAARFLEALASRAGEPPRRNTGPSDERPAAGFQRPRDLRASKSLTSRPLSSAVFCREPPRSGLCPPIPSRRPECWHSNLSAYFPSDDASCLSRIDLPDLELATIDLTTFTY